VIYHYISTVLSMYALHAGSWFYIGLLCAIKWWCCSLLRVCTDVYCCRPSTVYVSAYIHLHVWHLCMHYSIQRVIF